jgi:hypothetical protein
LIDVPIPIWEVSHLKVYCSLFPGDYDFSDFINEKVTDDFHKIYVYYDDGQYIWINHEQLIEWQIDEPIRPFCFCGSLV